ncbi:protein of unknown function [Methylocaldum szegediense]|uniref:Transposase n=1 Tax=Methylocaldum szegediense TaxID=73780 RepID=A0ABM9HYJ7_9GAMM|nr:protein of unknown function [Methylocaldum szegediense]
MRLSGEPDKPAEWLRLVFPAGTRRYRERPTASQHRFLNNLHANFFNLNLSMTYKMPGF